MLTTTLPRRALAAGAAAAAAVLSACSSPIPDVDLPGPKGDGAGYFADVADFDVVEHSGDGDGVIELDGITDAMVTATHDGQHYFSISGLDEANEPTAELLVTTLGAYEGTTALGVTRAESARLEITADGAWTVTLAPLADAPALPEGGAGDGVYRHDGDAGTWAVEHFGEHYFSLSVYTGGDFEVGLLATEVGAYDGDVAVKAGPALVVVQADGDWTIAPQ